MTENQSTIRYEIQKRCPVEGVGGRMMQWREVADCAISAQHARELLRNLRAGASPGVEYRLVMVVREVLDE